MLVHVGFNSRAPRGARLAEDLIGDYQPKFQFTCPSRSTTKNARGFFDDMKFQFTCPSRSTTISSSLPPTTLTVSIHVPLAEHDVKTAESNAAPLIVSIHVPLAEHDFR